MASIQKVALAGATGNLGPAILDQLLQAGFETTVLTRAGSTHTFPPAVKVAPVDYESLDSLAAALAGQDALVSTLGSMALDRQLLLVEAAAKAGVRRVLPSEFGSDTTNPQTAQLPVFAHKVAVQEALRAKAAAGPLTYTLVVNGPLFDWGCRIGWLVNVPAKTITLWDGGARPFGGTTLAAVGRAVVGVLRHPAETANRVVRVQEVQLTLQKLQALAQQAAGGGAAGWTAVPANIADELAAGYAELQQPQPDPAKFAMNFINTSIFGEGYGQPFAETDNALLGIQPLSDAGVVALLQSMQ